jgi:hypothetical protein
LTLTTMTSNEDPIKHYLGEFLKESTKPLPKTPDPIDDWWQSKGLRHYVRGETFEESMKWAYLQGILFSHKNSKNDRE